MTRAFADTAYYIALLMRRDALHEAAKAFDARNDESGTVTTDAVLVEVLAHFSKRGSHARSAAVELVDALRVDDRVTIIH